MHRRYLGDSFKLFRSEGEFNEFIDYLIASMTI